MEVLTGAVITMLIITVCISLYLAREMIAALVGAVFLVHTLHPKAIDKPEYHYRRCKECDYVYMVSSEYVGPDPGCPACGAESWHTQTTGLLHKYIFGKWQDIDAPELLPAHRLPRITGFSAGNPLYEKQPRLTSPFTVQSSPRTKLPLELRNISRHSPLWEPTLEGNDE